MYILGVLGVGFSVLGGILTGIVQLFKAINKKN